MLKKENIKQNILLKSNTIGNIKPQLDFGEESSSWKPKDFTLYRVSFKF